MSIAICTGAAGLLLCGVFHALAAASGEAEKAAHGQVPDLPATVWEGKVARLGTVTVDAARKTLTVTGHVNQAVGLIELLACGPQGKTHESVLVLDVNPMHMQAGMLLLGLKPGRGPTAPGEGKPEGAAMDITVSWQDGDAVRSVPAETLVYDIENEKMLPRTGWIFTGSKVLDGEFMAQSEESLVATYWDPWAIVNLPLDVGANDELLVVNTNTVPELHTPVTVEFKARNQGRTP